MELTHLDDTGAARMVNVAAKDITERFAAAEGTVLMKPETMQAITTGSGPKGDVLAVARVAGIMAAKRTGELIPLCHPLPLDGVTVSFEPDGTGRLIVRATATITARTGVEMEALTAVSVAALTVYDMCKAIDKDMTINGIRLMEKKGGRSGHYRRSDK